MWALREPPRAIAHIGVLFSCLVVAGQMSSFGRSPEFDNIAYELLSRDTASRRSRQAGQRSLAVARKEARRAKAPARADHPFKGIALILLRPYSSGPRT